MAAGRCTDYLTAGDGRPVILFTTESRRAALIDRFRRDVKLISPVLEERIDGEMDAEWINGFLDGLGLENVRMIFDAPCVPLIHRFSEAVANRLSGIYILSESAPRD